MTTLRERFLGRGRPLLAIVIAGAAMVSGCAGGHRDGLPPQVAEQVALLTRILTGEKGTDNDKYHAALKLGEIGLKYDLPEETIAALKAETADDSLGSWTLDMMDIGGGPLTIRAGDGARSAFWMWEMQKMRTDAERLAFLWSKFCDPANGDGVRIFCVDQFAKMKSDAVVPYLTAAAASTTGHQGDWYVRGRATQKLCLFLHLPQTEGIIHLLTGSWDENVADAAKEALKEYGIGPPSDRPRDKP
jgi:hypothetical protein